MNPYPFPVEPMGVGQILDRSFKTYLKKFSSFALFALLINGVFTLFFWALQQYYMLKSGYTADSVLQILQDISKNPSDPDAMLSQIYELMRSVSPSWIGILSFAVSLFVIPLVSGGLAYIATGYFLGEDRTPGEWFSLVKANYKSLFITSICSMLMVAGVAILLTIALLFVSILFGFITALSSFIGVLLFIALAIAFVVIALFLGGCYAMVFPVAIRENLSGFAPIMRAFRIGFTKFWRTAGVIFLVGLLIGIVSGVVSGIFNGIAAAVPGGTMVFVAALINQLVSLLLAPLIPIAMCLHYISIRIETEGWPTAEQAAATGTPTFYPSDSGSGSSDAGSSDAGSSDNSDNSDPEGPQSL